MKHPYINNHAEFDGKISYVLFTFWPVEYLRYGPFSLKDECEWIHRLLQHSYFAVIKALMPDRAVKIGIFVLGRD